MTPSEHTDIRLYGDADFAACRDLWVELTQRHRDIYGDPSIGGDDPGTAFEEYLKEDGLRGPWVVSEDNHVLGFAGLLMHGTESAELEPVVVTAGRRSSGIGAALVKRVVEEARALGVVTLTVRPVARNAEAIAFFARAGFTTLGQIDLFQELTDTGRKWREGAVIAGTPFRI